MNYEQALEWVNQHNAHEIAALVVEYSEQARKAKDYALQVDWLMDMENVINRMLERENLKLKHRIADIEDVVIDGMKEGA